MTNIRLHTRLALAACAALIAVSSIAAEPSRDVPAQLSKTLHERYPEVPIVDVRPGPMAGLYEVYTGTAIVYSDASGEHLFAGEMIETKTRRSLTAESLEARNTIDFSSLPLDMAIKEVRGDGNSERRAFFGIGGGAKFVQQDKR